MISKELKEFVRRRSLEKVFFPAAADLGDAAQGPGTGNLILDLSNFIKLSSVTLDGNPVSMLAAKYVLQADNEIKQALDSLGYLPQVKDAQDNVAQAGYTSDDISVKNRLGNLNWYEQVPIAESLGYNRLDNRQGLDFCRLIESGLNGAKVLDGLDQELRINEIQDIKDKLMKKENPWRSEYLDTRFEVADKNVIVYSGHYTDANLPLQERIKPENIKAKYRIEIPKNSIAMSDGWTKFSDFNEQGLCTRLEQSDEIYSWYPRDNAVARLYASAGRFYLGCSRDPLLSDPWLGMRLAKILR